MNVSDIFKSTLAPPLTVVEPYEVIRDRILKRVKRDHPDAIVVPFTKRKSTDK